ncbi:exodeoxyribonuclease V subunit gamma [Nocardioides insulae]|uniref:exodeoxyribonuclease V subunit gamma n=1 Tax=Nocardioides insulae TaxID=394734 RepID=UPI000423D09A|nr:exodeoxyribonuclease V subunit gamma [Nocardioides insulae]
MLHLHRSSRTDLLADALGELLASPLDDPFAEEVVVVPARGVERWLSQRLSHRLGVGGRGGDGICAGVSFRSPRALFAGLERTDEHDPWSAQALVWPVLAALDSSLDQPWARTLARHLGHGLSGGVAEDEAELRRGRRYAVARRLARLFAAYAVQRPALIADWAAGRDTDGQGSDVPADLAWQPPLWRRAAELVAGPTPTERHARTLTRLAEQPDLLDLPARVSVFGHTRLAEGETSLLAGLAEHRDVHLWLPHPSADQWERLRGVTGVVARRADRTHESVQHPLLAALGRDTRELQRGLSGLPGSDEHVGEPPPLADHLLGWLQADLRANRVGPASERPLRRADRSVQVHACHGPARQVEVLREVLLGLLSDRPDLEPRDVLVMCPDIETYAPLIQASFGLGEAVEEDGHPGHRLRVRLADRALDQTNPLLALALRLLDLAGGRGGAGEVLDLAHEAPVRRRFRFREDDLEQLVTWVERAGVRWGFDASHREPFGLADYAANTWRFGLDRLLTGVALSDDSEAGLPGVLPVDDVGSGDVDLLGRLAELVDRLRIATDRLTGVRPLGQWLTAIEEGVGSLCSVSAADGWQLGQLQRVLRELAAEAGEGPDLRLPDVREMLAGQLVGRPTRANFRTGTLTVATLVPMRSVPHRVVALLGLDDGVFPRTGSTDGDDVLVRTPLTGERDVRSEDRQLLLDAILAATETLVVTYSGAGELTGQPKPPAVPLGELLDTLDLTATPERPGTRVAELVTVRHPLQPFDPRNHEPDALVPGVPFSFDAAALTGARTQGRDRSPAPVFLPRPLPALHTDVVELDDLVSFYASPVRAFLRQRLGLTSAREDEPLEDRIPVELDGLEQWGVGERVLGDMLRGLDRDACIRREVDRGLLPPGQLGLRVLERIMRQVHPLGVEALQHRRTPARSVDVDVDLGDGRVLRGTVSEVYGDRLVPVSYSRLGPKHRLASWVRLLALAASDEDRSWRSYTIGRPENFRANKSFDASQLGPLDETAPVLLRDLVVLRDQGLCEPVPLPLKSSLQYARQRRTRADAEAALDKAMWEWRRSGGEREDAEHVRVWGERAPLPGRDRPGTHETSWFGEVAMQVWSPLLRAEVGSR